MPTLTAVSRAVSHIHAIPDAEARRAEARRVASLIDDLHPRTGDETLRKLWTQLGRQIAGGNWLMGQDVTAEQARTACLDVLATDPPRRGRGRPPLPGRERVETMLYPAEVAQVEALIGTEGRNRSDVIATLVRRALQQHA